MFSTQYGTDFPFWMHFKMSSAICFDLDQSKILSSDNGLMRHSKTILEKEENDGNQNFLLPGFSPFLKMLHTLPKKDIHFDNCFHTQFQQV